ncbi:ATP-dependent RNA helicase SrmB [Methylobacterium tardum]|uniref:DEAD/DEAH box helicase n=2 Tax=Methylobacterium TaxID=407 RepID=A0ABV1R6Z8_9HYPH|nr:MULTISPECIES: DEAD/DEAH box helicase [Methylobacterium]MCX7334664.1 DEAD/DEAH box helicase [Hyphomicrobiales bacterium]AWV15266.1 ATP-dependent helicase [Methylobacterium sp. XJLW]MDE3749958.1 DEAD/DEAH box helicase [Methylobacterium radiotolerans]PVY88464.1 ATP-dependent Lhr-like helicase [Methylobacterium organophilum]GJE48251.1 ATP-dependent RNA helicase SrmB [Methylobacterium tardum]
MTGARAPGAHVVPDAASTAFEALAEPVRRWIWRQGWTALREVQEMAVPAILAGGDVILSARTAAGKTEAAFLPLLTRVLPRLDGGRPGFAILYVCPLKALINDQHRRLEGLLQACDVPLHRWHGDVPADAKRKARERPQGVVLITPESLEATLVRRGPDAARLFGALDAVVVDELHAFVGTERGRQLQSLLTRVEVACGRDHVDRVGLSATLGDMRLAREALRPGAPDSVRLVESREGGADLLLQVRGYERPPRNGTGSEAADARREGAPDADGPERAEPVKPAPDANGADEPIASHLFEVLRGRRNLLFAGSRQRVEVYADRLRALAEDARLPNEFFAHHGNLARAEREAVETRLREDGRPTTAVATTTLELGIDIGDVESVAQIGPGPSVSSLRQRLGRSGRRPGMPSVLRIYVAEEAAGPTLHPADRLRLDLVQAVATVDLLLERWCEPPRVGGLHLSTLTHQVLALVAQTGGLRPDAAWRTLCGRGPFRNVSRDLFVELLRAIARPEAALVEMSPDGLLMLGPAGERLAEGHQFYAVFQTDEEYRVMVVGGKVLGTVPLDLTLAPGQTIIFNGRRWRIESLDARAKVVVVAPTKSALPPRFGGGWSGVHDAVAAAMRRCLSGTGMPAYLDAGARALLDQGRAAFLGYGLDGTCIVEVGRDCTVLPWVGAAKLETLALTLLARNLQATPYGHAVEVRGCSAGDLRAVLTDIAGSPPPDAGALAGLAAKPVREKYDGYLTDALLARSLAVERLEADAVPDVARRILEPGA